MSKRLIALIACCYLIFYVAIPPFQGNDEPDHFQYIFYLSKGIYPRLPTKSGVYAFDPLITKVYDIVEVVSNDFAIPNFPKIKKAVQENKGFTMQKDHLTYQVHHPPLYFILAQAFFKPADYVLKGLIPIYYATRLISGVFFALSVYVAFRIGLRITKKREVAELLATVYAINPVTLKMAVAVNPDIASTCMGLIILLFCINLGSKSVISRKSILLTVMLLSASIYTKFQNIVFVGFFGLFFLLRGMQKKQILKHLFIAGSVGVMTGILIFPLLFYAITTYHAITPSYVAYALFCTANLPSFPWYRIPFEVIYEFRHAFFHFAGFLGWGEPYPFKPFFIGYALSFISLIILGVYSITRIKQKKNWIILLLYSMMVLLFFVGVSTTYKINRYSCDVQGRYLLSVLFPIIILAWRGLSSKRKSLELPVAFYLLVFALWQFLFILFTVLIPRYYV